MQEGKGGRDGRDGRRESQHREHSRERQRAERDRDGRHDREVRDRDRERHDKDRDRPASRPQQRPEHHPQRSSGGARAAGIPPRPQSRAAESEGRPAEAKGLPKRASANPLVAEVARLARERLAREEAAAAAAESGSDHDSAPDRVASHRRAAWRDEDQGGDAGREKEEREEGEMAEPGELPPEGGAVAADATGELPPGFGVGDKGKRKHAPIVWMTPPKAPKVEHAGGVRAGMHHAQSSSGIAAMGEGNAAAEGAQRPRSAAEIAQAEVEAFAAAQAELDAEGQGGYMKASPDVSSPEEEQHIRREGTTAPHGASEGDEGEDGRSSPGTAAPKPASRWLFDDAEPAAPGPGPAPLAGPAPMEGTSPKDEDGGEALASSDEEEEQAVAGASPAVEEVAAKRAKREVSMLDECRSVDRYEKLNRINEGTYGVVYRARNRDTGEICALKKVKLEKERDGFPLTSVREINILLSLHHPNIVNVSEVVVGGSLDSVFMVMEYADHDLKAVMEGRMTQPFSVAEVKCLMRQLLSGVAYLHSHWVLHRDLKTSNILYTNRGELKLCDFGLARQYGSPLKPYTHMVVTLWYRAIELLLGTKTYSTAVDMWSCGCIMAELLSRESLFPGKNEMEQISLIFKTLGTPTEETWPGLSKLPNYRRFNFSSGHPNVLRKKFPPPGLVFDGRAALSDAGFDLLSRLLEYSPERRISAEEALEHPWFREHPLPKDMALMPTFPATNDSVHAHGAARRKAAH